MRRAVVALPVAIAIAIVFAGAAGCPRQTPSSRTVHPKLVVLIVVDQLPTWIFERDRSLFKGGFARLLRDGGYVRAAELPYANPFTAPGHASIATGAPPSVHGVLSNTWFRRLQQRELAAELDPEGTVFSVGPSQGGELSPDDSASARVLRVDGIADILRRASLERAHSVAIGLKPRAAAFVAGRRPDLVIWYDAAAGGMTTSRAYAPEPPPWLVKLALDHPATRFFKESWTPLDPAVLARVTGIPDAAPGEGDIEGFGVAFPHELAKSVAPQKLFLHTPYADEMVLETALTSLDAMELGNDNIPDLLAISFNAHDYAGHLWGPESWEALDLTLRFDLTLGRLFDALDKRLGHDGWAVVLTSDHGATPVVERGTARGRRIPTGEIMKAAEAVLVRRLGQGPWVAALTSGNLYLTPAFARIQDPRRAEALTAAANAISALPNIAAAGVVERLAGNCAARTDLDRAICLSIVPEESGDLYVVPTAGSLITDYKTGTHHDAPFDDNRRVPIFVMGPGIAPQQGIGSLLQVAPTVSALLGIPPPEAATEKPLFGLTSR